MSISLDVEYPPEALCLETWPSFPRTLRPPEPLASCQSSLLGGALGAPSTVASWMLGAKREAGAGIVAGCWMDGSLLGAERREVPPHTSFPLQDVVQVYDVQNGF